MPSLLCALGHCPLQWQRRLKCILSSWRCVVYAQRVVAEQTFVRYKAAQAKK